MAPGFVHQSLSDPVILLHKMESLFAHIRPHQSRCTFNDQPNGVPTGMAVNTFKDMLFHSISILLDMLEFVPSKLVQIYGSLLGFFTFDIIVYPSFQNGQGHRTLT